MVKRILASAATLTLLALPLSAQAMQHNDGEQVTLTGHVIDVYCYSTMGAKGDAHKACATACAKAGEPLAILTGDGTIYMPVSNKPGDPQNSRLLPFVEGEVTVSGLHREVNGLHTIQIQTIKAAS
jgi:DNA/RNA endonuclease YhcR with UshA esterase domain